MGMLVENNLLATASAVELSDNVGIRMGILAPGTKSAGYIYKRDLG